MLEIVEIKLRGTLMDMRTLIDFMVSQQMHPNAATLDASQPAGTVGNEPANDPAPVASPSTKTDATASPVVDNGKRDSRGVIWHADHHSKPSKTSDGKNAKGEWKKRKGYNEAATAAYEAQFLGGNVTSGTVPSTTAESGGDLDPAAALASMEPVAPTNGMPPAVARVPDANNPSYDDLCNLWFELGRTGKIDSTHENYILKTYGGHITFGTTFRDDAAKRRACYADLLPLKG